MKYYKLKKQTHNRRFWLIYLFWGLFSFIHSIKNIIRWMPILYRDRDWDYYYIYSILQKKLEHVRKELVSSTDCSDEMNKDLTLTLNLLERIKNEYYIDEYINSGNMNEYLFRYRHSLKKYKNISRDDIPMKICADMQAKCKRIFWKLMDYKINSWWV